MGGNGDISFGKGQKMVLEVGDGQEVIHDLGSVLVIRNLILPQAGNLQHNFARNLWSSFLQITPI
jgi:hypothetical protein